MTPEIIVALIGLLGSAIGSFVGIAVNSRLTAYRIEQLEKRVDRHNHVIERVYKLEQRHAVTDEDLRGVYRRLDALEGGERRV